jgi:hypothetical protein
VKERWLFAGMVLLLLVPLWSVGYLPTTDGPSHVYNASILRHYGNPLFQEHFEIDWRPIPNWFSHAVLALLMFVVEPRVAEKVLLSGYVVLFAASARYLAGSVDPERRWLGWLALPLVYNQLLQTGFYNFGFSLAFYLFAVGYWWRHRSSPGWRTALGLNLLLLLCWFSHIVSLVLALASIGVLWLLTDRRLLHPLILAPQVLLPLWFVQDQGKGPVPATWSADFVWTYLLRLRVLHSFTREQIWIGTALAVLFLVLAVLTLVGRLSPHPPAPSPSRTPGPPGEGEIATSSPVPTISASPERRSHFWRGAFRSRAPLSRRSGRAAGRGAGGEGFLLLSLLAAALYVLSPEGMSGGTHLKNRLSLYPWLLLIPWLAPRGRWVKGTAVAILALMTAFQVWITVRWYRTVEPEIRELLAAAGPIAPHSRVLPLMFRRNAAAGGPGVLGHALDYAAAGKGWVSWGNYEAMTGHFPVRFRRERGVSDVFGIEAHPGQLNLRAYRGRTDYVFTWKMPPESPMARQLDRHFRFLEERGPARVYRRRGQAPTVRE